MKKKGIVTAIISIVAVLLIGYFIIENPIVAYHNGQLKKEISSIGDKKTVTLNEIVPFDWDTVYTFSPYTSKEEIEQIIGFNSNLIIETVNEGMVQLLFVKGKTVTASICGYADNLGYSINFKNSVAFDENKTFSVDKTSSIIKLTSQ